MRDPLPITVVVPAYDAARYLGAALASVRDGERGPAEVVVVDDGSTDATAEIARAFGARVISGPNGGQAHARNVGIRAAQTPWIAFLDADDAWRPAKLARQWTALEAAPEALIVASDYAYVVRDRVVVDAVLPTLSYFRAMERRVVAPGISLVAGVEHGRALVAGNFVLPSTLLVHRRIFGEHGVYFAERETLPDGGIEFSVAEDYEWYLRALRHSDVLFVESPLLDYRRSAASSSANGGRLKRGDVVLGELVRAAPERYVAGVADAFARARPTHLREAGMRYARANDIVRARAMFVAASAAGDARARALALAAFPFAAFALGRKLFSTAYALWRTRIRPFVRPSAY